MNIWKRIRVIGINLSLSSLNIHEILKEGTHLNSGSRNVLMDRNDMIIMMRKIGRRRMRRNGYKYNK